MRFVAIVLAAAVGVTNAWWDVGHQTVGAIAKQLMKDEKAKENLANILSYLDNIYTDESGIWPFGDFKVDATQRPPMQSTDLHHAAVWPDVIKGFYNVKIFDNWHYVNDKYDPDNLDTENTGCNTASDTNIVTVLTSLVKQVPDTYSGRPTARWYQHFALGYIAHNVGDLHQPYHTLGRCIMYEGQLDQDLGGNRWLVTMPDGQATNAHAMWDSVGFVWGNDKQAEIEESDPDYEKFAADLIAKISVDDLKAAGYDIDFTADSDVTQFADRLQVWAKESNNIAIESYNKVPFNSTIDQVVVDWVVETSELRVVAAGYRLAALLDGMLQPLDVPKFEATNRGALTITAPTADHADAETEAAEAAPAASSSSSGGYPIWTTIVAALGGLVVGGAIFYFVGRSRGRSVGVESTAEFGEKY